MNDKVLVLGVYLAEQEHLADHLVERFTCSESFDVEQQWVSLGDNHGVSAKLRAATVNAVLRRTPKFVLLNQILARADLAQYSHLVFTDDDIVLPPNFLDQYLELTNRFDFALAQPALTHTSYISHPIVERIDGLTARRTRFVEIGPLFSIRADLYDTLLPFDESSRMGWGYDFVWPRLVESESLRMGIVDATPVDHSLRPPATFYDGHAETKVMDRFVAQRSGLSKSHAFTILESYT